VSITNSAKKIATTSGIEGAREPLAGLGSGAIAVYEKPKRKPQMIMMGMQNKVETP
jgi:hypothetical protein